MTARVTAAADRAQKALREAVERPGTENTRKAAEAVLNLRKQFRHDELPDWAGRSPAYRDMIARVYRDAGVPADMGNNFQANLRYHIGNVLRQLAPPEELEALGLQSQGPLGRVRQTRQEQPRKRRRQKVMGDPVALATAAYGLVQALRTMEMNGASGKVESALRDVIDEALHVITELHEA